MTMKQELSRNIVFSFFSGNATPLQKKVIEQWLWEEYNLEQYFIWLEEWEREHPQFIPDAEQGLQTYWPRIEKGSRPFDRVILLQQPPSPARFRSWPW